MVGGRHQPPGEPPDLDRVKSAMQKCPLVVVNEAYADSETSHYAHLLLPAAQWSEKAGAMTNSERRVTYCPAYRRRFGESRPDWEAVSYTHLTLPTNREV